MKIAAVIPLYNNPDTILGIAAACRHYLADVLVVDDASTRLPEQFEETLARENIQLLRHARNRGVGGAMQTAFQALAAQNVDYAITLDADGQHSPDDIPLFLDAIEKSGQAKDVVFVGLRDFNAPNVPSSSKFGRSFSNFWVKLETGEACQDTQSGYRAYPVQVMTKFSCLTHRYTYIVESLVRCLWGGLQLVEIPITVKYAPPGQQISHFRPVMDNLRFSLLHTWLVTRRLLPWPVKRLVPKRKTSPLPNLFRHPKRFLQALLKENSTPQMLALSAGVSTFLAVLPLLSCHILVILYVCVCLRLNKVMALAIQNLYMPPVTPFLCIELGYRIRYGHFLTEASMQTILKEIHLRLLDWLVGSLILAPIFAIIASFLTYRIAKRIQTK